MTATDLPPILSIIVPYQNRAEDDRRPMLDALLGNLPDRADLEILLVDDHSTLPYTAQRSFALLSVRPVALPHGQTHAGPARNLAMGAAMGQWVAFVDSDDLIDPSGLAALLDGLHKGQWDEADLIVLQAFSFHHEHPDRHSTRHLFVNRWVKRAAGNPAALVRVPACWVRVVRAGFLKEAGIRFGPTKVAEDVDFAVDLGLARPRMAFAGFGLARIRAGHQSLTSRMNTQTRIQCLEVKLAANLRLRSGGMGAWEYPLMPEVIGLMQGDFRLGLTWLVRLIRQRARLMPGFSDLWLALLSRL